MMIRKICGIFLPVVVAAFLFTGCGQLGNASFQGSQQSVQDNEGMGQENTEQEDAGREHQGSLIAVYEALGASPSGRIAVKLSTGEPGSNYLRTGLIGDFVMSFEEPTIVECNTAYGGSRANTAMHYQVAEDHGGGKIRDGLSGREYPVYQCDEPSVCGL